MSGARTLSVCCITRDPGPRVAALLGELRDVADEIVVAADARVGATDLAHYASVADRLLRVEVDYADRHLAWLHAQCSGDWILRIDGDEVASPALVALLPELVADRSTMQCLIPRRWLYGDPDHWLDELPWWPDYQLRLVRNDGLLRIGGQHHAVAVAVRPARYLQAPLYHLDLLLNDADERRAKARRYDALRQHLKAPDGASLNARFYVPEGALTRDPARVPAPDRAPIGRVLGAAAASPAVRSLVEPPAAVGVAETDRHLPSREVDAAGCRAQITPLERLPSVAAGERRAIHVVFANTGSEPWPWDPGFGPPIVATYRIRDDGGRVVVADGPRTALPCTVAPGEETVVPLDVLAPVRPGRYVVEPDVVHEGVRWFGCAGRCEIDVAPPPGWNSDPPRPRSRRRERFWRNGRRSADRLPRVLHRVWLGDKLLPEEFERFGETWRTHHPEWEHRLWGNADVARLVPAGALARCRSSSEASDLARYAILAEQGGVYVDTDVECLRPLDALLDGVTAFAGEETPGSLATAVLGAVCDDPLFARAAVESRHTAGLGLSSIQATGPGFLRLLAARFDHLTVFDPAVFYPYRWDERERSGEHFPDAYAVHHWALSWRDGLDGPPR